ncbi:MAG: hypothetical protein A2097_11885 [Desulfobacula sp. GWF2_41_7]|nr:MAG: hypothetical protein A2097_11885 [Desulfobacula sp. GWF2_41_7]
MKAIETFWKIFDNILKILLYVSALIVLVTAIGVSVDTLMRYFFSISFTSIFELTEFGLLWMTFLGAPWLLKIHGHIQIDIVTSHLSERYRYITQVITAIISGLLLLAMTFYSTKLMLIDFQTGYKLAGVLRATKWPIEIVIPIGFLLLFIQSVRNSVEQLKMQESKSNLLL